MLAVSKITMSDLLRSPDSLILNQDECTICLEIIGSRNVRALPCGHLFHEECISAWLSDHQTCPYCRSQQQLVINARDRGLEVVDNLLTSILLDFPISTQIANGINHILKDCFQNYEIIARNSQDIARLGEPIHGRNNSEIHPYARIDQHLRARNVLPPYSLSTIFSAVAELQLEWDSSFELPHHYHVNILDRERANRYGSNWYRAPARARERDVTGIQSANHVPLGAHQLGSENISDGGETIVENDSPLGQAFFLVTRRFQPGSPNPDPEALSRAQALLGNKRVVPRDNSLQFLCFCCKSISFPSFYQCDMHRRSCRRN